MRFVIAVLLAAMGCATTEKSQPVQCTELVKQWAAAHQAAGHSWEGSVNPTPNVLIGGYSDGTTVYALALVGVGGQSPPDGSPFRPYTPCVSNGRPVRTYTAEVPMPRTEYN